LLASLQDRPTLIFVTHSIEEAIQLSTRVCVISPMPGRIERVIDIDLPSPRDLTGKRTQKFSVYASKIEEIFHGYGVL
jgi:NitT/TauT family transport system ATP-binding protein